MTTKFRLDKVAIYSTEGPVEYQFPSDLTVLAGSTGVGKTTLLELIKWGLGGDGQLAPVITDKVQDLSLEISIGDERLRLSRSIDPQKRANVRVTDLVTGDRLPDHQVKLGDSSLNTLLMTSLGLPSDMRAAAQTGRSTKAGSRITFADIFTYMYIPQAEINRDIARSQDSYLEPKRKAVFELLFGLADPDLFDQRSRANTLKGSVDEAEDHHQKILQFLRDSNTQSREEAQQELDKALAQQREAEEQRADLRDRIDPVTDRETQALRDLLNEAERSLADARKADVSLGRQKEELSGERRRVQGDLARLNRMRDAGERLAQIEFTTCPRCMQALKNREVPAGHCRLCLLPDETASTDELDHYETVQLKDQLEEMEKQLVFVEQQSQNGRQLILDRQKLVQHLETAIDSRTAERVSPRLQAYSDMSEKLAASRTAQKHFENVLQQWDRVSDLARAEEELRQRYDRLVREIEQKEENLKARRKYIVGEISKEFNRVVSDLQIPGVEEASIHETNYLPLLNGKPFRQFSRGGGIVTATQVAYWTALIAVALRERDVPYPMFLLIDSPRLALNEEQDLSAGLYRRLVTLAEANEGRVQLIIADHALPAAYRKDYDEIDFSYKKPTISSIRHPGKGNVKPLVSA
ncbi:AAA family ATPase [Streptomyces sp. NBC_00474]|uniref:AAA family ATPase n=1 Tax=Streptomyces sp. NBC_00474 TaxID=2975754 RepID=UPI00225A9DF0|nr:AAA family ATPase [Streptomyces sp. NBC_00474]MCX5055114.1 AAA family ATPase [Streptomyces sp. NBC_00474]